MQDTEWFENKKSKRRGGGNNGNGGMASSSAAAISSRSYPELSPSGNSSAALAGAAAVTELDEVEAGIASLSGELTPLHNVSLVVDDEEEKGPTMMSREARALFLSGEDGGRALQAWKVSKGT